MQYLHKNLYGSNKKWINYRHFMCKLQFSEKAYQIRAYRIDITKIYLRMDDRPRKNKLACYEIRSNMKTKIKTTIETFK